MSTEKSDSTTAYPLKDLRNKSDGVELTSRYKVVILFIKPIETDKSYSRINSNLSDLFQKSLQFGRRWEDIRSGQVQRQRSYQCRGPAGLVM